MSPQSPQPRKRASKQEMLEREQEVISMIIHGFSKTQVLQTLIGQGFHEKKARRAHERAIDTIAGLSHEGSDFQRGKVLSRMDSLYKNSMVGQNKNLKVGLQVVALEAKMLPPITGEKPNATSITAASSLPQRDMLTPRLAGYFSKDKCKGVIERSTD